MQPSHLHAVISWAQMLITISCALAGVIPADLVAALAVDCLLTTVVVVAAARCCCAAPPNGPRWDYLPPRSETPSGSGSGRDRVKRPGESDLSPRSKGKNKPRATPRRRKDLAGNSTRNVVGRPQRATGKQPVAEPRPQEPPLTYVSALPGIQERGKQAYASLNIRSPRPLTPGEWMSPDGCGS